MINEQVKCDYFDAVRRYYGNETVVNNCLCSTRDLRKVAGFFYVGGSKHCPVPPVYKYTTYIILSVCVIVIAVVFVVVYKYSIRKSKRRYSVIPRDE